MSTPVETDPAYWGWVMAGDDCVLLDREPESLAADEVLDYLAALKRQRSMIDALEARALVVASGTHRRVREIVVYDDLTDDERSFELVDEVREEVAAVLVRSPITVDHQITHARMLVGWLRPTLAALEDGRITAAQARAVTDAAVRLAASWPAVHQLPDPDSPDDARDRLEFARACAQLERYLLPRLPGLTPGRAATMARRLVARIDAAGEQVRRRQPARTSDVQVYPDTDGQAVVHARMPIEAAACVQAAVETRARELQAAHRSTVASGGAESPPLAIGHWRVQALVEALCGQVGAGTVGTGTVGVEIQVVVPLDALLGVDDLPGSITLGTGASEPLLADSVRALLSDDTIPATLRRLVTDPLTGHLLDRGRNAYAVTESLRAFLSARDGTCRFPGCGRSAQGRGSQVDHALPWDSGGVTDRSNLGHLCLRHHQLKTHAGWDIIDTRESGAVRWRTPGGREYSWDPLPIAM